jgi:hypothetical protein
MVSLPMEIGLKPTPIERFSFAGAGRNYGDEPSQPSRRLGRQKAIAPCTQPAGHAFCDG